MLKHTAIMWACMDPHVSVGSAAEFSDTSPAAIRKRHWRHSPSHRNEGLAAAERRK